MKLLKNSVKQGLGPGGGFHCRALDIGLGVLIAAVPLTYSLLAPNTLKWAIVGFLTFVVGFFWLWGGCGRPFRPLPRLVPPMLVLLLASQLSLIQALNLYYGFQRFVILLVLFLLYLIIAYTSAQPDRRATIIRYLVLTLLGCSILSLLGYAATSPADFATPAARLFYLFGNTNYGAAYLIMVIPFSVALCLSASQRWEKVVWGTTLCLSTALLTLSMVRGGWVSIWIGLFVVVGVFYYGEGSRVPRIPRQRKVVTSLLDCSGILLGVALWPVYLPGQESIGQRAASIFDIKDSTMQIRLSLWEGTLQMIRDHPLTGVGIGNFPFASVPYRTASIYQDPGIRLEHPHNEYLNLWAELGPLGLLALAWLGAGFVRLGWQLARRPGVSGDVLAGALGGLAAAAAYSGLFYVVHVPASAMTVAILFGLLEGMDREAGPNERVEPVRRIPLVVGLLVMLALSVEYFLRPLAGEVHYWLAERSFQARRIDAGLSRLERSLAWDSQSYQARYRRAAILYAMRRYPDTIREAEMTLKIHPNLDVAYGIMGSAYLNLGEKAKAKEIFGHALELNPNYPHAINNLGVLAADEGRTAEAESLFLRAIAILGRTRMKPYANLGDLYEETGRTRDALQMYETAVTIQPKSGSSWYHVARLKALTDGQRGVYDALARAIRLEEKWRAMAVKDSAFAAVRQTDPRVRTLLYPSID